MAVLIEMDDQGNELSRTEIPDQPDPIAEAYAAVEAATSWAAAKPHVLAYLSLLPGGTS